MKYAFVAMLAFVPVITHAQSVIYNNPSCCVTTAWTAGPSGDQDVFYTAHRWQLKSAGILELTGTKFRIKFNADDLSYTLLYDDKELSLSKILAETKARGIAIAKDMQEMGVLK